MTKTSTPSLQSRSEPWDLERFYTDVISVYCASIVDADPRPPALVPILHVCTPDWHEKHNRLQALEAVGVDPRELTRADEFFGTAALKSYNTFVRPRQKQLSKVGWARGVGREG